MTLSIAGKTAIVTGAGNGIGRAIARHFVDRGARVMFVDQDEAALERELSPASPATEGQIRWFAGDLRQKLAVSNVLAATTDAFGHIDILVNAARFFGTSDPLSPDADAVEAMWQQNVLTALRMTQQVSQRMIKQAASDPGDAPRGAIINLSSIAARLTHPELLAWSMASSGIEAMTRSMAVALAPHNIRVNCIAFGSVLSASLQATLKDHPDWRDEMRRITPLNRIGAPQDLTEAAQFLASDAAGFITGQVLTVDGGRGLIDPVRLPAH